MSYVHWVAYLIGRYPVSSIDHSYTIDDMNRHVHPWLRRSRLTIRSMVKAGKA
jgi:hypothetical protein